MATKVKFSNRNDRIISEKTPFSIVEAYRTLRTNLFFAVAANENACKKILFTSTMATEGKTTTAVNLSITLAQTNKKVLLVDCDLRKPRVHKFLKIRDKVGLSSYISGEIEAKEVVIPSTFKNLSVVIAGIIPPNPAELLSSPAMAKFINEVSADYDFMIIDAPPLDSVADALILVPLTDGTVIVAKHNVTTHPMLQKTIKKLEFVDAKLLGIVLNDYEEKKSYKYYKYDYKYKSEYLGKK